METNNDKYAGLTPKQKTNAIRKEKRRIEKRKAKIIAKIALEKMREKFALSIKKHREEMRKKEVKNAKITDIKKPQ